MYKVKIEGLANFTNRLTKLAGNARQRKKLMQNIANTMLFSVRSNFWDEVGESGKWKPLKYRKGTPLRLTGRMFMSLKTRANEDKAVVGTNIKYAPQHNFGKGRIPQRQFMWIRQRDKDIINQKFINHMLAK